MGKNTKVVVSKKPSKNEYKRDKKFIYKEKHKQPKEKKKINWIPILIVIVAIVIILEVVLIVTKKIKTQKFQDYGIEVENEETKYEVRKFGNGQVTIPSGWAYETRTENNYKLLDIYPNEDDLITISSAQYNLETLELTKEEIYQQMYDSATQNIEESQKHDLVDIKLGDYTYKSPASHIQYKEMYIRPFYYMSMKDGYIYSITISSMNEITDETLNRFKDMFDSIKF